jgi:hypothetical protein
MSIDYYSEKLQKLLQSNVIIKCNRKTLKSGVIKLFNIKQYFIKFYIQTDKKEEKILELPYPFLIEENDKGVTLNYHLTSLSNNHKEMNKLVNSINAVGSNKIYNNIITITTVN